MTNVFLQIVYAFGPLVAFVILMAIIYIRGSRTNKKLLESLENKIKENLDEYAYEIKRVQIKPDEYEFRCAPKNKRIKILTVHLKLANRSFIVQWLVNLIAKEKERLFLGVKLGNEFGDEDPVYHFDMVPYRKKSYIRQRFDYFVEMDDIPTPDKEIDNEFMIKSETQSYVSHITENPEFLRLIKITKPHLESLSIQKAKEETDPHISVTFEFKGLRNPPVESFFQLFFMVVNQHLSNHDNVKKLIMKGSKGKVSTRRGAAKRGGATKTHSKKQKQRRK